MSSSNVNNTLEEVISEVEGAAENQQIEEQISDADMMQIVTFSLSNNVEYGIDILSIDEILKMVEISRLPNTPDYIKGVINRRGNVVPVVNVRKRFSYPENEYTSDTRIVVVRIDTKLVGLLVDKVYQVVKIPFRDISSPSNLIEGVSAEFIKGVGRMKDRLIIIVKLDNMLFSEIKKVE